MAGSDSRLPAAQSLTAPPFPDPPFPAQPLPDRPSTPEPAPAAWDAGVQVEIVIPVRNEERDLAPSVRRLDAHLRDHFPFTARITIAEVEHLVEPGEIDGDHIITPGVFVQRIIHTTAEKRIEARTVRKRATAPEPFGTGEEV